MTIDKNYYFNSIISILVFLSISSLLIRGSFYSALISGITVFIYIFYIIKNPSKFQFNNKKDLPILFIPFVIVLVGFLFSDDKIRALEFIFRSLPLVVFPFFYSIINPKATLRGYRYVERNFPILVAFVFFVYITLGYYITSKGLGDYLFYSNFSQILDIHPTYSGCLVNLGLFFAIQQLNLISKYWHFIVLGIFLIFLLIIGSKSSIFIGLILSMYSIFKMKAGWVKKLALIIIPLVFLVVSISFLESRLVNRKLGADENVNNIVLLENIFRNDIRSRILLWKSNVSALEGYEFIFGKGTAANNLDRLKEYNKNELNYAIEHNYNAHNMYIEILYHYGIIGLLLFLFHCLYLCKLIIKQKQWFYLILLLSFYVYFMFESMLIRSFGIILYAYVITYIYVNLKYFEQKTF